MTKREFPDIGETLWTERLRNGLTICVVHRPNYRKTFAFFATNYGGMDVTWQEHGRAIQTPAGVAHFLEHKMFDTKEGNALQILAANGASVNAFTSNAITGYYFESTQGFEANLRTLLSFVSVPYFTEESVAKEQGIIGQEIRMIEDSPEFQVYANLLAALYSQHPLKISVPGTAESIAEITADTLYRCHRTFYHPCNMVLTVAGDVNPRTVTEIARAVLPDTVQEPPVHDFGGTEPARANQSTHEVKMEVSSPIYYAGFKCTPPPMGTQSLRMQLVGELATELLCGNSSPLYARMYRAGLINKTFGAEFSLEPGAAFLLAGGEGKEPETVRQMVLQEARQLAAGEPDPSRFNRVRRACYGARMRGLNSFEGVCISLARTHFAGACYFDFGHLYQSITPEEVLRFLEENITQERSALSIIAPKQR